MFVRRPMIQRRALLVLLVACALVAMHQLTGVAHAASHATSCPHATANHSVSHADEMDYMGSCILDGHACKASVPGDEDLVEPSRALLFHARHIGARLTGGRHFHRGADPPDLCSLSVSRT